MHSSKIRTVRLLTVVGGVEGDVSGGVEGGVQGFVCPGGVHPPAQMPTPPVNRMTDR